MIARVFPRRTKITRNLFIYRPPLESPAMDVVEASGNKGDNERINDEQV